MRASNQPWLAQNSIDREELIASRIKVEAKLLNSISHCNAFAAARAFECCGKREYRYGRAGQHEKAN